MTFNPQYRRDPNSHSAGLGVRRWLTGLLTVGVVVVLAGTGVLTSGTAALAADINDDSIEATLVYPSTYAPRADEIGPEGTGLKYSVDGNSIINHTGGAAVSGESPVKLKLPVLGGTRVWEIMSGKFAGSCIDLPSSYELPMVIVDCATAPKFQFKKVPDFGGFWTLYAPGRGYADNFVFRSEIDQFTDNFSKLAVLASPAVSLAQSGTHDDTNGNGGAEAGETVSFSFTVTNTGPAMLTNIVVSAPALGAVSCRTTELAPGASTTCSAAPHTLTQDDINAGSVTNTATVSGRSLAGDEATAPSTATVELVTMGALSITRTGVLVDGNHNTTAEAGEKAAFTVTVSNTGGVTVAGIAVADSALGAMTCPADPLAPGATVVCEVTSVTLTQAQIDAGSLSGTATATGTDPAGKTVSESAESTLKLDAVSGIAVATSGILVDSDSNGHADAGERAVFTVTVTNTGGLTLTGVTVTDALLGTITCPTEPLAPGASATCTTTSITLTHEQIDAGVLAGTSTATGTDPGGRTTAGTSDYSLQLDATPAAVTLVLNAALADTNNNALGDAGESITYSYTVTNTGGTTLSRLAVTDSLGSTIRCEVTTLAVDQAVTCTAPAYTITARDADARRVTNTATATTTTVANTALTATAEATTTTTAPPVAAVLAFTGTDITPLVVVVLALFALSAATLTVRARTTHGARQQHTARGE